MKRDIKTLEQDYVDMRNQLLETGATEEEIAYNFYAEMRNQLLEKGFTEEEIAQYFYAKVSGDKFDEKLFPIKISTGTI